VDLPEAPVALYLGTLHEDRLDVALVDALAAARPDLAVVLVGPDVLSAPSRHALDRHENVHRVGPRPYDQVPGYLQHADVLLVPHVVSSFTDSLDPIKAYEYLAVRRPVVTTPVAGFRELGAPVRVAGRGEFVAAVDDALHDGPAPSPSVALPSWRQRADAFAAALRAARGARPAPPLRVAVVDHCAQLSGGEIALARLVAATRDAVGDRPAVEAHVVLGEAGPLELRLAEAGAHVEVLPLDRRVGEVRRRDARPWSLGAGRLVALASDIGRLTLRLRALEPDVVHTNSLKAALYGGVAARLAGRPVVWHVRDRLAADYLPGAAVAMVRGLALVLPDAIVVDSEAVRSTLGPVRRSRRVPVELIPSPVAAAAPATADPSTGTGPSAAGGRLRVAMVGRLAAWKGQDVFVAACALASQSVELDAVVVGRALFGDEPYEAELRAQVERAGLGDRVRFAGFVEDVPSLLAEVDVVVHASVIAEPFGLVVVEAMAAGAAVVATDLGGPREVVTDGVDGLLCPPGEPAALAACLVRLARDPDLRRRLGQAARVTAEAYAPEQVAPRFVDCLAAAARRGRPTRRRRDRGPGLAER
jgi:glycosyltransferase involved in cell wall biosynthesis